MAIATAAALLIGGLAASGATIASSAINANAQKKANAAPAALPPPPNPQDATDAARADAQRRALQRTQTVYTTPLGLSDDAKKKQFFGS